MVNFGFKYCTQQSLILTKKTVELSLYTLTTSDFSLNTYMKLNKSLRY